jgi:hypothetical protein
MLICLSIYTHGDGIREEQLSAKHVCASDVHVFFRSRFLLQELSWKGITGCCFEISYQRLSV